MDGDTRKLYTSPSKMLAKTTTTTKKSRGRSPPAAYSDKALSKKKSRYASLQFLFCKYHILIKIYLHYCLGHDYF
jgi:hypothetical protein